MRRIPWIVLLCIALAAAAACKKKAEPAAGPAAAPAGPAPAAVEPAAAPTTPPAVEEPKPVEEPAAPARDMKAVKVQAAEGWEGEYNEILESWTFEKYTPNEEGTNDPNRFYVDVFPEDTPTDAETYASKLQSDPGFQDMGYVFTEIASKETLESGWLILGTQKDTSDAEDAGSPAFVMFRKDVNVRCHGGTFVSAELRDEAVAACRSLAF